MEPLTWGIWCCQHTLLVFGIAWHCAWEDPLPCTHALESERSYTALLLCIKIHTVVENYILKWMTEHRDYYLGLCCIIISAAWDFLLPLFFFLCSLPFSPSLLFFSPLIRGVANCACSVNVVAPIFISDYSFPS